MNLAWISLLGTLLLTGAGVDRALACTSLLAAANQTPTGDPEGTAFVTYNADDSTGFGYLKFFPAQNHTEAYIDIIDPNTGAKLGEIPQANSTWNVVHRANQYGVAIGESTWEGLPELQTPFPGSLMDYDTLIDLALMRARSAMEAAGVITSLAELYGWTSLGETFSIGDLSTSVILEVIGKGTYGKGVVWAIQALPPNTVAAHANQPRITKCRDGCYMHKDTIPFARSLGYKGTDQDFSFSDFFQPVTPESARVCEARVWSAFQKLTNGGMNDYVKYARGWDLTKRMPLYITPTVSVTREVLFDIMRDTYENTFFAFNDTDTYVGSGPYSAPYRPRPLTFRVDGRTYVNERPIGTQQTLTSHVSEIRKIDELPVPYQTIVWFGVDDTVLSTRLPIYTGVSEIPKSFAKNLSPLEFSFDSAFWVFNMVANFAYSAFDYIAPTVIEEARKVEWEHVKAIEEMDKQLINTSSDHGITERILEMGDKLTARWLALWKSIFVRYKDTYILTKQDNVLAPSSAFQEVPQSWYNRIVKESGDRFFLPESQRTETVIRKHEDNAERDNRKGKERYL